MFYGWRVVLATTLTQTAQAGLLIYGFATIAPSLETEFGIPRARVMLTTTCLSLATSFAAPFVGRLVDRQPIRRLMLIGAVALATGFAALGLAQAIWQVWLIYALLLPAANLLLGQLTSAALVTRWFTARRGRAMGLSSLGTSLGGFAFPLLLTIGIESLGWRVATAAIGVGTALVAALMIAGNVVDRPEVVGLATDGEAATPDVASREAPLSTAEILRRPAFWIITIAIGIKVATYLGTVSNLVGFATGLGLSGLAAASLLSTLSIASMVGKVGFGLIAERVALKTVLIGALGATILAMVGLLMVGSYPALVVLCLLLGLATGGLLPVWSLLIGEYFGPASFGRVLGLTNLVMVPLTAVSAPFAGWMFDRTGRYDEAFIGFIVALGVALLLALPLGRSGRGTVTVAS